MLSLGVEQEQHTLVLLQQDALKTHAAQHGRTQGFDDDESLVLSQAMLSRAALQP